MSTEPRQSHLPVRPTKSSVAEKASRLNILAIALIAAVMPNASTAQTTSPFTEIVRTSYFLHLVEVAIDFIVNSETIFGLKPVVAGTAISPPHVALIEKRFAGNGFDAARFCEGILYREKYVITAASCSDFAKASQVQVLAKTTDATGVGGVIVNVKSIRIHPNWNPNISYEYDIAVWELANPVTGIASVSLATPTTPSTGYAHSTSWSYQSEGTNYSVPLLRSRLSLTTNADCNLIYSNTITARMLCAGVVEGSTTAPAGDVGGPLYGYVASDMRYELLGINSFGSTIAGTVGASIVYTRIASPSIRSFVTGIAGQ